jgi:hypothetical protein
MQRKIIFLFLIVISLINSGCSIFHKKNIQNDECPMWEEIKKYIEKDNQ